MTRKLAVTLLLALGLSLASPLAAGASSVRDGSVPIPVADKACPSPDGSAGGFGPGDIIDHIPIVGGVVSLSEQIGNILDTFQGWVHDPGKFAHDVIGWFTWHLVGWNPDAPGCYEPTSAYGFFRSVLTGDVRLGASGVYHDAYESLALGSMVVVLLAGMARVVRAASDPRREWSGVVIDVLPRVIVGMAGVQLGFAAIDLVLPLCSSVGADVFKAMLAIGGPHVPSQDPLGVLLFGGLTRLSNMGLVAVLLAPVLLFFLVRTLFLLVARFLIVSFGIAFAPLVIAVAVFDHRSRPVRWWAMMMGGAALTPIVAGGMIGLTVGLSLRFAQGDASMSSLSVGPLVSVIIMIGGLWLTSKAIRALLFEAGHQGGGLLTALRYAAEVAIVLPMVAAGLSLVVPGSAGAMLGALGSRGAAGGGILSAAKTRRAMAGSAADPAHGPDVFAAFKASPAGQALARAATADSLSQDASPEERWAHLEGMDSARDAVNQLRDAVTASVVREGDMDVAPHERDAFLKAVRSSDPTRGGDAGGSGVGGAA